MDGVQDEKQAPATAREYMDPFSYMGIGVLLGVIGWWMAVGGQGAVLGLGVVLGAIGSIMMMVGVIAQGVRVGLSAPPRDDVEMTVS